MTRLLPGKTICSSCEVAVECAAYAIQHHIEYGIWGGLDPSQRRRLRASWGLGL